MNLLSSFFCHPRRISRHTAAVCVLCSWRRDVRHVSSCPYRVHPHPHLHSWDTNNTGPTLGQKIHRVPLTELPSVIQVSDGCWGAVSRWCMWHFIRTFSVANHLWMCFMCEKMKIKIKKGDLWESAVNCCHQPEKVQSLSKWQCCCDFLPAPTKAVWMRFKSPVQQISAQHQYSRLAGVRGAGLQVGKKP